ncbi:MAG: Cof-type HAD-IIB family hydrolase [Psychromonas sp.]
MYKVLALDLDGTVLNSEHGIHPEVKAAIREATEVCHVVLVTGRHHTAAKPYHEELGLDSPIICCNGTYVFDFHENKVLTENSIAKENAKKFLELANEHKMKVVLYVTHSMTYSRSQPIDYMTAMEQWAEGFSAEQRPDIRRIDSFEQEIDNAEHIWKFVIEGEPESIAKIEQIDFVKQNFSGERSWSNRVDFANRGNSKGGRLAEYLQQNGYLPEEMMAVGDNHNDISMLQLAGLSVAMKNADEKVKTAADIVCSSDNNQGDLANLIREKIKG